MLVVDLSINRTHQAAEIKIVRTDPHGKLKNHFWYRYSVKIDTGVFYQGKVLHNYDSGAIALTQKVTKAIIAQQKAAKASK